VQDQRGAVCGRSLQHDAARDACDHGARVGGASRTGWRAAGRDRLMLFPRVRRFLRNLRLDRGWEERVEGRPAGRARATSRPCGGRGT